MRWRTLGQIGGAALVAVLVSRLLLLLAFHPTFSDVPNYENSAARVVSIVAAKLSPSGGQGEGGPQGGLEGASSPIYPAYPALAIAFMTAAGFNVARFDPVYPDAYADQYRLLMFGIDLLILVMLFAAARWSSGDRDRSGADRVRPLAIYGLGGIAFAYLIYDRLDLVVGALLLLSLFLILRGSWRTSFVFLALAIDFKAVPLVLAPLWIVGSLPSTFWRSGLPLGWGRTARPILTRTIFLMGSIAIFFLPFVAAVGSLAVNFIRFNAVRGVQLESIPSSILLVLHPIGVPIQVVDAFGAFDVESPAAPVIAALSPLLVAVAVLAGTGVYALALRRSVSRLSTAAGSAPADELAAASDPQRFVAATLLILLLTIVLSKVLSPQYLLWILPIAPLLAIGSERGRRFALWFLAAAFLSVLIFPILYDKEFVRAGPAGQLLEPGVLGVVVLLLRNGILVGLAVLALRLVMTRPEGLSVVPPVGLTPSVSPAAVRRGRIQIARLSGAANNRAAAAWIGRLAAWVDLETEGVADSAMRGDKFILGRAFVPGVRVAAIRAGGLGPFSVRARTRHQLLVRLDADALGIRSAGIAHRSVVPVQSARLTLPHGGP